MALTFKIKLSGSTKPPIWRKVKVNESISFAEFHEIIQIAMGWGDGHYYLFSQKGWGDNPQISIDDEMEPFSKPSTWPNGENYEAAKIKLSQYFSMPKQTITYIYDFGDDWEHKIELLEITDEKLKYPVCLSGKGACPPEDCGGIWGYYDMVEIVNSARHPERKDMREWLGMERGEKWDVNAFDVEDVNWVLRE